MGSRRGEEYRNPGISSAGLWSIIGFYRHMGFFNIWQPERNTKKRSKKRCLEMIELTGLKIMEKEDQNIFGGMKYADWESHRLITGQNFWSWMSLRPGLIKESPVP